MKRREEKKLEPGEWNKLMEKWVCWKNKREWNSRKEKKLCEVFLFFFQDDDNLRRHSTVCNYFMNRRHFQARWDQHFPCPLLTFWIKHLLYFISRNWQKPLLKYAFSSTPLQYILYNHSFLIPHLNVQLIPYLSLLKKNVLQFCGFWTVTISFEVSQ